MIQTIEHATSTRITIGQNGLIVVSGKNKDGTQLAIKATRMVEEEAHTSNLTQRIKQLLGVEDNVQIDSKSRSDAPIDNDEGHDDSMLGNKKSVVQSESESPSRDQ